MSWYKRIALILVFCSCLVIVAVASAASNYTQTYFAGITFARAEKYVSTDTYHNYVNCSTYSFTYSPETNITLIGYNTFSCTSYRSDGVTVQWKNLNGSVDNNDWHHSQQRTIFAPGQSGKTRQGVSAGSHDFNHFDGQSHHWDPSLSAEEVFSP